jgi:hypothetical protein
MGQSVDGGRQAELINLLAKPPHGGSKSRRSRSDCSIIHFKHSGERQNSGPFLEHLASLARNRKQISGKGYADELDGRHSVLDEK